MADGEKFDILEIRDYYPSENNPSSSTWVYGQVFSLTKMGYRPLVISPTPINPLKHIFRDRFWLYDVPSNKIENYKGTNVIRPGYFKIPRNKFVGLSLSNLSKCIKMCGNVRSLKLIHAHFGQNGIAALALKQILSIPLITSFYGYDSGRLGERFKPYYKELIQKGDLFLALSRDMKADLIALGFPEKKILIHHLGIDVRDFRPIKYDNNKFTFLTVARLDPGKGIQFVIRALALFFQKHPEEKSKIRYNIVGGGPYREALEQLVVQRNLSNNVNFINNLILPNSREIVNNEMKKCDIFCLCSHKGKSGYKEGTPVVLMEAQACGKPCIATLHAGIPEVVIDNHTGLLVEEESVTEILQAIEALYFDERMRMLFADNASRHVSKEFNHKIQMIKLGELFGEMLSNKIMSTNQRINGRG